MMVYRSGLLLNRLWLFVVGILKGFLTSQVMLDYPHLNFVEEIFEHFLLFNFRKI